MSGPSDTMSDFSGTVEFTLDSVNWEPICKLVIDENAKLRELVDYMKPIAWYAASERERDRMRELGIEV